MMEKLRTSFLLPAELADTVLRYQQVLVDGAILPNEGGDTEAREPFLQKVFTFLNDDQKRVQKALTAVRSNLLVEALTEADATRDDLFIGFRDTIDAFKRRKSADLQEAYQLVWPVIKSIGTRLNTLSYAGESGRLDALFEELDQEPFQVALTTLKAKEVYDELKQAQADFVVIHDMRLDKDVKRNYPTLSTAKASMVKHVNILLGTLELLGEAEPESYSDVVEKINGITVEVMTMARARKTRQEGGEEDSEEVTMVAEPA